MIFTLYPLQAVKTIENSPRLNKGIYTYPEIARILDIPYHRISRWLNSYWEGDLGREFGRKYTWTIDSTKAVDFFTMVELYVFYHLNEAGVPPRRILAAHKELTSMYGVNHPFADKSILEGLKSDGKAVLFEVESEAVISLNGSRQFNLPFIMEFMKKLDFEDGKVVSRLWPMGKDHAIVCDPRRQFGHPILEATNIFPQTISGMHAAGDSVEFIAHLYDLPISAVQDAIEFDRAA